jgi:hypothetical protein
MNFSSDECGAVTCTLQIHDGLSEGAEINIAAQVTLAQVRERVHKLVLFNGLFNHSRLTWCISIVNCGVTHAQTVSRRSIMAVVNEQRGSTVLGQSCANILGDGQALK